MTEKVNPSPQRPIEAFKTAGVIAEAGSSYDGFIVRGSNPTRIATQDGGIDETALNTFAQSSSSGSLDVTIDPGEAFIYGSWLVKDITTTVTLSASTSNQTIYAGWDKDATNDVIVGTDADFSNTAGNTDQRLPLFDFDTDGSGVTSVTERRTIGRTVSGRFIQNTATVSSDYTTDGEQIVFVDTSSSAITVTLSTADLDRGSSVIVTDIAGNAVANNITVTTEGSETIDGGTAVTINTDYGTVEYATDGSNWYSAGGGSGGAFTDRDGDSIGELLSTLTGVQLSDDAVVQWGNNEDFEAVYDATANRFELRDGTTPILYGKNDALYVENNVAARSITTSDLRM